MPTKTHLTRFALAAFVLIVAGCHAKKETYCQRSCAHVRTCKPSGAKADCESRCVAMFDKLAKLDEKGDASRTRGRDLFDCQDKCYRMPLGQPVESEVTSSPECRAIADCARECRSKHAGRLDPEN